MPSELTKRENGVATGLRDSQRIDGDLSTAMGQRSYCIDRIIGAAVDGVQGARETNQAVCVFFQFGKSCGPLAFEDETGIANAIFKPDLYDSHHAEIMQGRLLAVEGELQNMDDTISVKVRVLKELQLSEMKAASHDFH
jgi:hypothetical protein